MVLLSLEELNNYISQNMEDYNNEPVVYCKNCLSLKIMILNGNVDYCDECGCTDTGTTDIESWRKMYREKYGRDF